MLCLTIFFLVTKIHNHVLREIYCYVPPSLATHHPFMLLEKLLLKTAASTSPSTPILLQLLDVNGDPLLHNVKLLSAQQ